MKRFTKITAILLAAIMCISLSACSGNTNDSGVITLNVYDENSYDAGILTGWFADVIYEKFNVRLNITSTSKAGFNAYAESGNIGDIIILNNMTDYRTAIRNKCLYNWEYENMIEYAPYLSTNLMDVLKISGELVSLDGIYGVFGNVDSEPDGIRTPVNLPYVRWDLYAELGYPECNTLEDLEQILIDMTNLCKKKTGNDKIYAVSTCEDNDGAMVDLIATTAALYGYEQFGIGLYNPKTDTYEECIDPDGIYVRCLKFYNALNRAGVFDPSSTTHDYSTMVEKYNEGRVLFATTGNITDKFYPIRIADASPVVSQNNIYGTGDIWCVGAKTEYPDICIQLIDWLYQPEGVLTSSVGPQGICWDYDENGDPYLTDIGYKCINNLTTVLPNDMGSYYEGMSPFNTLTWNYDSTIPGKDYCYSYTTWPSTQESEELSKDDIFKDWSEHTGYTDISDYTADSDYTMIPSNYYYLPNVPDEISIPLSQIASVICVATWKAIAAPDDATFNQVIDEMYNLAHAYRYEPVLEHYMNALDEYREAIK